MCLADSVQKLVGRLVGTYFPNIVQSAKADWLSNILTAALGELISYQLHYGPWQEKKRRLDINGCYQMYYLL